MRACSFIRDKYTEHAAAEKCNRQRPARVLPLHAGIEAGYAPNPVTDLTGHVEFPDQLRCRLLGHFHYAGVKWICAQKAFIELHVTVRKQVHTPHCFGIVQRRILPEDVRGAPRLIHLKEGYSAVTGRLARGSTQVTIVVEDPRVTVVEESQSENARAVWAQEPNIVLPVHPGGGRSRIQCEVALISEFPENVA